MPESPYRLTVLTVAGILLAGAGFVCCNFHSVYSSPPLLMTCFTCAVIGVLGMYWASYVLGEGIQNERWSEDTLAPFRLVTDHVLWKSGGVVLVVTMLATLNLDRHHRTWFLFVFFIGQTQMRITSAFARARRAPGSLTRIDWSLMSPLHSEHWGER